MQKKTLVIIFDEEDLTQTLVENYLKEVTFPYELLKFKEFDETLIPKDNEKKIIIVNVKISRAMIFRKISLLAKNNTNFFLVISYDKSVDLQVTAIRTGAKDFLPKPLIQADFINAITNIYKNEIMLKATDFDPKVYSVVSASSGVGKTFFALNFAKELADASKENVLLIDFNSNLNDLSFLLNLSIPYNTPFFINRLKEDNPEETLRYINRYRSSSLYIIANGIRGNHESVINEKKIIPSFQILKRYFKYIIVDIDMNALKTNDELFKITNEFYLITTSSISNAISTKKYIANKLVDKKVKIILNMYNPKKHEQLIYSLEEKLGQQISAIIPRNVIAISKSQSQCRSLNEIAPQLDISKIYVQLAKDVVDRK